jgi:DNA polymerase elongation subunit (family B)
MAYMNIFADRRNNVAHVWDDKTGYQQYPLESFRYAYKKSPSGKFLSVYDDPLVKVVNFDDTDPELFESDVPLETRILVDLYKDSDEVSEGHRLVVIDIEVDSTGGFPNIEDPDKEVTAICLYDQLTNEYNVLVLDPDDRISHEKISIELIHNGKLKVRGFENETSLLKAFLNLWETLSPTIVSGWNLAKFDLPYLYNRLKGELGYNSSKRLSPIGAAYVSTWNGRITIGGVSCLDYMDMFKLFPIKKEPSYSLNYIGKKFAGIEKISYDGNLNTLYKTDINRFIDYNVNDVQIVVELDHRKKYIDLARNICHAGHVPYECFDTSSRYIEGAILTYLKNTTQRIVQNKPSGGRQDYERQLEEGEEGFSGAYVKRPVPGKYDWVYDLDLTSEYPSVIISLNISPETKVGKVIRVEFEPDCVEQRLSELEEEFHDLPDKRRRKFLDENKVSLANGPKLYAKQNINKFNIDSHVRDQIKEYHCVIGGIEKDYTAAEFNGLLSENKYSLSSNGILYRTDKPGVIPSILVDWFKLRAEYRKKSKAAFARGDMVEYAYYDQRQYTMKIMLNSVYGVTGLPVFRFYDQDNAEAVTTTGVSVIKMAGSAINAYYRSILNEDKDFVIYSDTDSVAPDSVVVTNKFGEIGISDLFDKLSGENHRFAEDLVGRKFIFPNDLELPVYDKSSDVVKTGKVRYLEKHKVKKPMYRITTKSGRFVDVTADHSVMVMKNGKLEKTTPGQLNKNDKIIALS